MYIKAADDEVHTWFEEELCLQLQWSQSAGYMNARGIGVFEINAHLHGAGPEPSMHAHV